MSREPASSGGPVNTPSTSERRTRRSASIAVAICADIWSLSGILSTWERGVGVGEVGGGDRGVGEVRRWGGGGGGGERCDEFGRERADVYYIARDDNLV